MVRAGSPTCCELDTLAMVSDWPGLLLAGSMTYAQVTTRSGATRKPATAVFPSGSRMRTTDESSEPVINPHMTL